LILVDVAAEALYEFGRAQLVCHDASIRDGEAGVVVDKAREEPIERFPVLERRPLVQPAPVVRQGIAKALGICQATCYRHFEAAAKWAK
jgi:hypothetical protein